MIAILQFLFFNAVLFSLTTFWPIYIKSWPTKHCLFITTWQVFQWIQFQAQTQTEGVLPMSRVQLMFVFPQSDFDTQSHLSPFPASEHFLSVMLNYHVLQLVIYFHSNVLHLKRLDISHERKHLWRNPVVSSNHSQGAPKELRDRESVAKMEGQIFSIAIVYKP